MSSPIKALLDESQKDLIVLEPEERRDAVVGVIRSAREHLILSIFRCNDFKVLDAIGQAVQTGVKVEVLLTGRAKGGKRKLVELQGTLAELGADVRSYMDPVVKYHAKYIVADAGLALVASLNFTKKCFTQTCDFLVTTRDAAVVDGLKRLFASDWAAPTSLFPTDLSRRLVVGPEGARAQLTELIQRARRRIRIVDPKLTDPAMMDLLKARKAAGINVSVATGETSGLTPHGKLILIDDKVAVIGSVALSALSLDFRREVALVVRERRAVARLGDFYASLSRESDAPVPAFLKDSTS